MAVTRGQQRRPFRRQQQLQDIRFAECWVVMKTILCWCLRSLWKIARLNPINILWYRIRNMYKLDEQTDLPIKPPWFQRIGDIFLPDSKRKSRLLKWVRSRTPHVDIDDFTYSWQDGIALCALMESVCPGVCPRYFLLKSDMRVNNCRLALQIAHSFLNIKMIVISPEEMAIAHSDSEQKIIHLVHMIKWRQHTVAKSPAIVANTVHVPVRRVLSRCFARGAGLKTGIIGCRTKFNIITDCAGNPQVAVEIEGPNNERDSCCIMHTTKGDRPDRDSEGERIGERINSKNKFQSFVVRADSLSLHCYKFGNGRYQMSYVPQSPGLHKISVKSHDHHIQGSPFDVQVSHGSLGFKLKGKLIPLEKQNQQDDRARRKAVEQLVSSRFLEAGKENGPKRKSENVKFNSRVVRKMMTKNGDDIVLSDSSRSTSPSPISDPFSQCVTYQKQIETVVERTSSTRWSSDRSKLEFSGSGNQDPLASDISVDSTSSWSGFSDHTSHKLKRTRSSDSGATFSIGELSVASSSGEGSLSHNCSSLSEDIDDPKLRITAEQMLTNTPNKNLPKRSQKSLAGYFLPIRNSGRRNESEETKQRPIVRPKAKLADTKKVSRMWFSLDIPSSCESERDSVDREPPHDHSTDSGGDEMSRVDLGRSINPATPVSLGAAIHGKLKDFLRTQNFSNSLQEHQDSQEASESSHNNQKAARTEAADLTTGKVNCSTTDQGKKGHKNVEDLPRAKEETTVDMIDKATQVCNMDIKQEIQSATGMYARRRRKNYIYENTSGREVTHPGKTEDRQRGTSAEGCSALRNLRNLNTDANSHSAVRIWLDKLNCSSISFSIEKQPFVESLDCELSDDIITKRFVQARESKQRRWSLGDIAIVKTVVRMDKYKLLKSLSMVEKRQVNNSLWSFHRDEETSFPQNILRLADVNSSTMVSFDAHKDEDVSFKALTDPSANGFCKRFLSQLTEKKSIGHRVTFSDICQDEKSSDAKKEGEAPPGGKNSHEHTFLTLCGRQSSPIQDGDQEESRLVENQTDITNNSNIDKTQAHFFYNEENGNDSFSEVTTDVLSDINALKGKAEQLDNIKDIYVLQGRTKRYEEVVFNKLLTSCSSLNTGINWDFEDSVDDECLVFGVGLSLGYVGIVNNFQVWVRFPHKGQLDVKVIGPRPEYVKDTSVVYTGDNLYEVMYEVTNPGVYIICVKWCEVYIRTSPFIIKVENI